MKRIVLLIAVVVFALAGCATLDPKVADLEQKVAKLERQVRNIQMSGATGAGANIYPVTGALTGGGTGALDKITTTGDKDAALVMFNDESTWGNAMFGFTLDVDGGGTESVPYIIDSGDGGNEDWEWVSMYARSFYGYTPWKEITGSCTFGTDCDGTLVRLVWGGVILSSADDTTITLPEIVASAPTTTQVLPGAAICVFNKDANENFLLDCHTNDNFIDETGTANAAGEYIGSTAAATSAGDFICVVAINDAAWSVAGYRGTIVKQ